MLNVMRKKKDLNFDDHFWHFIYELKMWLHSDGTKYLFDTRGHRWAMQGMHPPTRPKEVLTWHLILTENHRQNIFVRHIT